jgi:hypothetical protein
MTIAKSERTSAKESGIDTEGISPFSVYNPIEDSAMFSLFLSNPSITIDSPSDCIELESGDISILVFSVLRELVRDWSASVEVPLSGAIARRNKVNTMTQVR